MEQPGSVKSNTPDRHAQRSAAPVATAFRSFDKTQNNRGRLHRSAQCFPSIVEPGQQIVDALRPMFQAHELRGTEMRIFTQSIKQILRADPDIRIDGYTHSRTQPPFQKTGRLVPIEAVGVGQETQRKRLPAFQKSPPAEGKLRNALNAGSSLRPLHPSRSLSSAFRAT